MAIGPEPRTVGRADQMAAHPDTIFRPPNATAQNITNIQFASDPRDILGERFTRETGTATDYQQLTKSGQFGDDILGDPIAEEPIVVRMIVRNEWQHRDRRTIIGQRTRVHHGLLEVTVSPTLIRPEGSRSGAPRKYRMAQKGHARIFS